MKSPGIQNPAIAPHDYALALQRAVSWLGERHLLAEPVRRRNEERRPYFNARSSWHPQAGRAVA